MAKCFVKCYVVMQPKILLINSRIIQKRKVKLFIIAIQTLFGQKILLYLYTCFIKQKI